MRSAPTLPRLRTFFLINRDFIRCAVIAAAICLVTSSGAAQTPSGAAVPSPADFAKYPGLLSEFGQLFQKLQRDVRVPPPRSQSRLLSLLPESTIFYAAFPNYGDTSHQALAIFQSEVKENSVLRNWWQQGDMAANGPKIEDALEKFYLFSQYLGDEVVVSAWPSDGKNPKPLIFAEVRKPGLKDFLQQATRELTGKAGTEVRVLDVNELASVPDNRAAQQLAILVRPDFVVAALDAATLRSFNERLDKSSGEFVSTPFGRRVAQAYEGGTAVIVAADLQNIISQMPTGAEQNQKLFQRTGFSDAKYLVWEHKNVAGQAVSQMELSFSGPRHGVASWLAAPGHLGGLDFVSPSAMLAGAVLLKNPAEIFDDFKELATVSNPRAFAALTSMEQGLKLSFRDNLFRLLGGEIAYEVDNIKPPNAMWKIILRVNDPDQLQTTLTALLATMPMSAGQSEAGGITYHTLQMPSAQTAAAISYAFVDGYLVIAPSRDAVSEAIRIHRSGESLAKSKKFVMALPPGRGAEASALFYQLPSAMAALSMGQVFSGMAESPSQAADAAPAVVCAYGETSALREASLSGGMDAGLALIGAAIAIPNLMRARIAANEASAASTIRTANTAQVIYRSSYPERGYARDLARLGPDPRSKSVSPDHASVIDATLGNASCTGGDWCKKSGFRFIIAASCNKQRCEDYVVVGTPVDVNSGTRSFCSTSDGVVRVRGGSPLTEPVSLTECRSWPPLQ